ncbi:hypothetical protein ABZ951_25445 [Streptomyces sp. NPDC046215]|uniref:Transposase DDE domain-containing protein n=1 Tax=Streptomyces stramineus TaxID=173861 RepID=A0ABN0ZPF2_9ACTN
MGPRLIRGDDSNWTGRTAAAATGTTDRISAHSGSSCARTPASTSRAAAASSTALALQAVDGISERARRNDGLFGQRLHRARLLVGRQLHVPLARDGRAHPRAKIMMTAFTIALPYRP